MLLKDGSYLSKDFGDANGMTEPWINRDTSSYAAINIKFAYRVHVQRIFLIMNNNSTSISVGLTDLNGTDLEPSIGSQELRLCKSFAIMPKIFEGSCDEKGSQLVLFTDSAILPINKLVVLGIRCEKEKIKILSWPDHKIHVQDQDIQIDMPVIDEGCVKDQDKGFNVIIMEEGADIKYQIAWD